MGIANRYAFTNPTTAKVHRVMCAGDSITRGLAGALLGDPDADGYRLPLHLALNTAEFPHLMVGSVAREEGTLITLYPPNHYHAGYGSHSVAMLAALMPAILANTRPDIVSLHIGTVNCAAGTATATTVADYAAIIDLILAGGRGLLVNKVIPQGPTGNNPKVLELNAALPSLVTAARNLGGKIDIADLYTDFDVGWLPDDIHPAGADAHTFMGSRIAVGVQAVGAML